MKPTLIILLCCLIYSAKGQKLETLPSGLSGSGPITISMGTVRSGTIWVDSVTKPIYDTILVIMEYCDTAERKIVGFARNVFLHDLDVHWMRGWEVDEVRINGDCALRIIVAYLDADKQPLSKNIVVWQTR